VGLLEGVLRDPRRIHRGESRRQQLRDLGPGDFFGELAALDWGAGYGYARSASAVAGSEVRLLVLPALAFQALMHEAPAFAERIRGAVAERLPNS